MGAVKISGENAIIPLPSPSFSEQKPTVYRPLRRSHSGSDEDGGCWAKGMGLPNTHAS